MIAPDVFCMAPMGLARLHHPLYCKAALRMEEPAAWKGAHLVRFPKAGAKAEDCSSHRTVGLGSDPAKVFHRCVRSRAAKQLETRARPTQCGGLAGRATDVATHTVVTALALAAKQRMSCALLFVDYVAAFYNAVRQHVLPLGFSDCAWASFLAAAGWPAERVHVFLGEVRQAASSAPGSAFAKVGGDVHLAGIAAGSHDGTWFTLPSDSKLYAFERGCMPGDPLAD
eukprot:10854159-Alexandrium_andersonii.AAC.1